MTKRLAAVLVILAIALPMQAGFREVARAIDDHRGVSRVWIPFLGIARAAVWMVRPEGIHDFQLATFRGAEKVDARELQATVKAKLGPGFKPLVQVWSRKSSEWSFIYAKVSPDTDRIELVVLSHDDEDTVLVRVDVDASVIAKHIEHGPRNVTEVARR
ncbi:MAG: hypothetical protein ACLGH0_12155 [Thermoanaerobaculia bacterium]